jgi:ssDNA-binding replication factor A large subunit
MEGNYKQLVELISSNLNTPIEEIERKIEAKQAKLSGLISKEGAAQVVASELGVNFDKQLIKISQMVVGMKKINVVGKIINLFPVREYNKNGRSGRIGSFVLADDTSNIRVVLWDENHIDLIVKGEIFEKGVIEINNAGLRNGELHLTGFSEIKNSNQPFEKVVIERPVINKKISEFNQSDNASTRAVIVQMFEPKFFEVCPECRKKANENGCETHGKVIPERRALLNFVIDDGSDSMRAVVFSGEIDKLIPESELENSEVFSSKKDELLGKELIISGQIRRNKLYGNNEMIVSDVQEIDADKLIEELEK